MEEDEKNDRLNEAVCYEDDFTMEHKQEETNEASAAKKMLESNEVISKGRRRN